MTSFSPVFTVTSPATETAEGDKVQEERTARMPLQEHVFAECSRERILGLLAAMLPPAKQVGKHKSAHSTSRFEMDKGCVEMPMDICVVQ